MSINTSYNEDDVVQAIATALEMFYASLIQKIDGLNIQKVMKRKNPYLYRAKATRWKSTQILLNKDMLFRFQNCPGALPVVKRSRLHLQMQKTANESG